MLKWNIAVPKSVTSAVGQVGELARGRLDARPEQRPGKQRPLDDALEQARAGLRGVVAATRRMTAEHARGNTAATVDAAGFDGEYRKLAEDLNQVVAGHVAAGNQAKGELADLRERSELLDDASGVGLWQAVLVEADAFHARSVWTWSPEFRRMLGTGPPRSSRTFASRGRIAFTRRTRRAPSRRSGAT